MKFLDFYLNSVYIFYQKPLVYIVDASFNSGIFPDKMKIAKIRPFFKKGDRQDVQNYRQISILLVFSQNIIKADL
jgi:hypothetical protein